MEITLEEINDVRSKYIKASCCHSYKTPKGRCYTCPDWKAPAELDEEGLEEE